MPKKTKSVSRDGAANVLRVQLHLLIQMLFTTGVAPGLEGYTQEAISMTIVLRGPDGLVSTSVLAVPKAQEDTIKALLAAMQAGIDKAQGGPRPTIN